MEALLDSLKQHACEGELVILFGTGLYPQRSCRQLIEETLNAIAARNEYLQIYCEVIQNRGVLPEDFFRILYQLFQEDALMLLEAFRAVGVMPTHQSMASLIASRKIYALVSASVDNMLSLALSQKKLKPGTHYSLPAKSGGPNQVPIVHWLGGQLDDPDSLEVALEYKDSRLPVSTRGHFLQLIRQRAVLVLGLGPDDFRWHGIYGELLSAVRKGTQIYWLPAGEEEAVHHLLAVAGDQGHLLEGTPEVILATLAGEEAGPVPSATWEWEENIGVTWLQGCDDDALLLELSGRLLGTLVCRGYAMECLQRALQIYAEQEDHLALSRVYRAQGDLLYEQGLMEEAIESHSHALQEAQLAENIANLADTHDRLGFSFWNGSVADRAITHYTQAFAFFEDLEDHAKVAQTAYSLGIIYDAQEQFEKAREIFAKGITARQQLGDLLGEAALHFNLGVVWMKEGHMEEAEKSLKKALEIFEEQGSEDSAGEIHHHLGMLYQAQLQFPKARDHYAQAYQHLKETNDILGLSFAACNQGHIHTKLKEYDQAVDYYNEAIPIYTKMNDLNNLAAVFNNLGFVHYNRGQLKASEANFNKAAEIFAGVGDVYGLIRAHINLAGVYTAQTEFESAAECHRANIEMLEQLNDKGELATAFSSLAMAEIRLQKLPDAIKHLEKAVELYQSIGKEQEAKESLRLLYLLQKKL